MKKLQTLIIIIAPSYFILRMITGLIFNIQDMEWYDCLNPHEQKEYECSECGKPLETDDGYCSGTCFEASMI